MFRTNYYLLFLLLALAVMGSCSSPTAPAPADEVLVSGPKTGLANQPYRFTGTVNFTSHAMLYYRWTFDDSTFTSKLTSDTSSVSWVYQKLGQHIIHVDVFRTGDNARLCSATDTFTVAFELISFSVDTTQGDVLTSFLFTAHLFPDSSPRGGYLLGWLFDSTEMERWNTDTISYSFPTIGKHTVTVLYIDTTSKATVEAIGSVFVNSLPLSITATPSNANVLSPILFTATSLKWPANSVLHWDFGDGASYDTTGEAVTYSYGFTGSMMVRVSVHLGSNVIGTDSTIVQITPLLKGFNPSLLSSFHRAVALFSGAISESGTADCNLGGPNFSTDSLSWNGVHFSYNIGHSLFYKSDSTGPYFYTQNSMSDYSNFNGVFSSDGMTLDSVSASSGHSSSSETYQGAPAYSFSQESGSSTNGNSLQLIWFTPDSAAYGIRGVNLSKQIGFTSGCGSQATDPNGEDGDMTLSVNWNDPASLIITFYK